MSEQKAPASEDFDGKRVITEELLKEALRESENVTELEIKDFTVSPGSKPGENFASVILKVLVNTVEDGESRQHHLLVKTLPDDVNVRQVILKRAKTFQKESVTYSFLFPEMIELQKRQGVEPIVPVPKYYYGNVTDDNGIIILKDLRPYGYKMADPLQGADFEHSKIVMREIARFHAVSYALKQNLGIEGLKKKFESIFQESLMSSFQLTMIKQLQVQITPILVDLVCSTTDRDDVKERVSNYDFAKMQDMLRDILANPEEPFSFFCHGDFWCNNIVYKYDTDGRPVDAKFLDFQATRYATLTTDLVYFFYVSTTKSMRQAHLKELLKLYHVSFHEYLVPLNVDFPEFTFEKLQNLFNKTALFGIGPASGFLMALFSKLPADDKPAVSMIASGDSMDKFDMKSIVLNSPHKHKMQERITGIIEDAVDLGLM